MPEAEVRAGAGAEVVVIGAGPTGLTAAALLADYGVRVTLLERNASTSDEPRAISISDEGLRILQQLGVLATLAPDLLLDTGARFFGRSERLLAEVTPGATRLGQPGRSQFDQPDLEARLAEAVAARPNATLCLGAEVTGLVDGPGGVRLTVRRPEGEASVTANWVIACDGGRSFTRTVLGIDFDGGTQVEKWVVVDLRGAALAPEPFIDFHCNGVRPVVVVPGAGGRRRYEFMMLPGDDEATITSPASIARLVAPFQTVEQAEIRRAAVYVAHQRLAARYRSGHVLLAGDAAHLMPPFAGQGLNAGLRDAANVAWKVAAAACGTGTDALIDSYETERRPHARDMMRLSHRLGGVVMSTNPGVTVLRDYAAEVVGLVPSWRRRLTGADFPTPPHFAAGCLVPPRGGLPAAARALVGRALSQPCVSLESGEGVPLDTVLGAGWALLAPWQGGGIDVMTLPASLAGGDARIVTTHVEDPSRAFAAAARDWIVVRPDRYVAAVVPAGPDAAAATAADEAIEVLSAYSSVPAALLGALARR